MKKVSQNIFVCFFAPIFLFAFVFVPNSESSSNFLSYLVDIAFFRNFHEVAPGRFYRTGFLQEEDLRSAIKEYKIKTVIDLRLQDTKKSKAVKKERAIVQSENANYQHFRLSSRRVLPKERFQELVKYLKKAKEPILIHCRDGTHRSGFAAIIWEYLKRGRSIEDATKEHFGIRYGFSKLEREWAKHKEGFRTLDEVVWDYLDYRRKVKKPIEFVEWVEDYTEKYGVY